MTKEYQKPELVDLKNSKAAGACTSGSAPVTECAFGTLPAAGACGSGAAAGGGCQTGSNPA